jgi:hypothetical protein
MKLTGADLRRLREIEEQKEAVKRGERVAPPAVPSKREVKREVKQLKREHKQEQKEISKEFRREEKRLDRAEAKIEGKSRVGETRKIRKRSSFLTKAIVVVAILLIILMAFVLFI